MDGTSLVSWCPQYWLVLVKLIRKRRWPLIKWNYWPLEQGLCHKAGLPELINIIYVLSISLPHLSNCFVLISFTEHTSVQLSWSQNVPACGMMLESVTCILLRWAVNVNVVMSCVNLECSSCVYQFIWMSPGCTECIKVICNINHSVMYVFLVS